MAAIPAGLAALFIAAGHANHIPPAVLAGVASVESALGRNRGPSSAGAVGLMQFEPGTARGLGINPLNDRQAVYGAAKLLNQYGYQQNPLRALGAYNGGPGNPQYGYANQVMSAARALGPQLAGQSSMSIPGAPTTAPGFQAVTRSTFDQAGFQAAQRASIAGNYLKDAKSPFDIGPKTGLETGASSNPLVGLLGTKAPNPQDYTHAQTVLQRIAGGQPLAAHPAAVTAAGYSNPFAGAHVTPSRVDQGVDYVVNGPIRAIGSGHVAAILHYQGFGTYLVYQLDSGPHAGQFLYVSESMSPTVSVGQRLRAGQQIAEGHGGIETGFAQGGPTFLPMAQVLGGYREGARTAAGQAFDSLMRALGAPAGTTSGRPLTGRYPR